LNVSTAVVRQLNDTFRQTLAGGTVLITAGVMALGTDAQAAILTAVQGFDAFTCDNDPWNEHDMGALEVAGERIFWKIDYYDRSMTAGADNPADPETCQRVLTIMLAEEY